MGLNIPTVPRVLYPRRRTRVALQSPRPLAIAHNLHSFHHHHFHDNIMPDILADPSGAVPAPGNDDTATAILRPKKSYVLSLRLTLRGVLTMT